MAAVEALSHFEHPAAREALVGAAGSSDPDVQRAALIGLGIARAAEALSTVIAAARSPDPATRLVAVSALAGFDDPRRSWPCSPSAPPTATRACAPPPSASSPRGPGRRADPGADPACCSQPRSAGLARQALALPSPERIAGLLAALESADDELAPLLASALARMRRARGRRGARRALCTLANVAARKAAAIDPGRPGRHARRCDALRARPRTTPIPRCGGSARVVLG